MTKIWVLHLHSDEGDDISIHETEEKAQSALYKQVLYWWVEKRIKWPIWTKDRLETIDAYFNQLTDTQLDGEYYSITMKEVWWL